MSLLNNALREAEERQRRPDVTGAYTGAVQEGRGGQRWLVVLVFLLALGLAGAGLFWFLTMNDSSSPTTTGSEVKAPVSSGEGQVERAVAEKEVVVPPEPAKQPAQEISAPVAQVQAPSESIQEPEAEPEPEPKAEPEPERVAIQGASAPEPKAAVAKPEPSPQPEPAPAVKTTPRSPGAIDRQAAKDLESLIAGGRMVEAERRLANLSQSQSAPRSRFVVARALLVDGEIQRALSWLPEPVTASDSTLRLLRARAQHAGGRLDAAVATLSSNVPAVSEQPDYRVTLATLLQQQGQGQEAAVHWAELIAWDDSRAPWWVGLAIALEDQGETRGATRAYEQAAALPGLPPSLADYVQRRLQSLRAG